MWKSKVKNVTIAVYGRIWEGYAKQICLIYLKKQKENKWMIICKRDIRIYKWKIYNKYYKFSA